MVTHPFRTKKRKGWGTEVFRDTQPQRISLDFLLTRSLVVAVVVMVMVMVVVMVGMHDHHDLRLRRIRYRETEEEHRCEEELFHALS